MIFLYIGGAALAMALVLIAMSPLILERHRDRRIWKARHRRG